MLVSLSAAAGSGEGAGGGGGGGGGDGAVGGGGGGEEAAETAEEGEGQGLGEVAAEWRCQEVGGEVPGARQAFSLCEVGEQDDEVVGSGQWLLVFGGTSAGKNKKNAIRLALCARLIWCWCMLFGAAVCVCPRTSVCCLVLLCVCVSSY
jgi:hypothetical protein